MPVQTFTQHRFVYRLAVVAVLSLMTGCAERASNVSLDELARRHDARPRDAEPGLADVDVA
ncbi:MAG: hypothetical protein AAGL66_01420, partial [Pseudomonadota bacterium]